MPRGFFLTLISPWETGRKGKCIGHWVVQGRGGGLSAITILLYDGEIEAGEVTWVYPHPVYPSPQPSCMHHQQVPPQPSERQVPLWAGLTPTPSLSLSVSLRYCLMGSPHFPQHLTCPLSHAQPTTPCLFARTPKDMFDGDPCTTCIWGNCGVDRGPYTRAKPG